MLRSLPVNPNLETIEKEVRHLLHSVRQGNAAAIARWHSADAEARTEQARTADIQYLVAREYGFSGWKSLKKQISEDQRSQ